jgi:ABC-2 type transport system ATP-binding protein
MAEAAPMDAPVLRLRNLRKRFGRREALRGIDLELDSGQIVGVVGADGAGKTTLLRSLAGLLEIEADEAKVLGFDLRGDVTALKAEIGYVPQTFSLPRDLSVIENLRFTGRLHRLPRDQFESRSTELLERTGLARFADRPAGALSGGMKQKLAVSNALLVEPKILLLDEPTAGVDVVARAEIWSLLEGERHHALIVLSTSYLDEAEQAHRLIYLDEGRVVAAGTPDELRAAVGLDLYRVWGDEPLAIARAARALPFVLDARASLRFARIEVRRDAALGASRVLDHLRSLPGTVVRFAEQTDVDMEAALLALSRHVAGPLAAANGARR